MTLSRGTAAAIIGVVEKDANCKELIRSAFGLLIPPSLGIAGAARNIAMMAANAPEITMGPFAMYRRIQLIATAGRFNPVNLGPTPGQDPYICVGIAEATRDAINAALRRAKGGSLRLVKEADQSDRDSTTAHAATGITMRDGKRYIFDWHATLRVGDPMLFPSQNAWDKTEKGELFSAFTGWN